MNLPKPLRSPEVTTTGTTPSLCGEKDWHGIGIEHGADFEVEEHYQKEPQAGEQG